MIVLFLADNEANKTNNNSIATEVNGMNQLDNSIHLGDSTSAVTNYLLLSANHKKPDEPVLVSRLATQTESVDKDQRSNEFDLNGQNQMVHDKLSNEMLFIQSVVNNLKTEF